MNKYYFPEDIRNADRIAVDKYGLESYFLMKNAGKGAAKIILDRYSSIDNFMIFCGPGNNGGDGFVVAKWLLQNHKNVIIITSVNRDKYKKDNLLALNELTQCDYDNLIIKEFDSSSPNDISTYIDKSDCYIDALLGTGTNGEPRDNISKILKLIQGISSKVKIALDLPTGVDAKNGKLYSNYFKAELTITFLEKKTGMTFYPASEVCGEIVESGIGIDKTKVLFNVRPMTTYDTVDISSFIPKFPRDIHKGTRGAVFIYGGSFRYRGAPILSALGALRTGCGVVYVAIPDFMVGSASILLPEAVFIPLKTHNNEVMLDGLSDTIMPALEKCSSAVLGPGVGRYLGVKEVLDIFYNRTNIPLVVDADALFFINDNNFNYRENLVITPHHGEASTILNRNITDIKDQRLDAVQMLSSRYGVALLKGINTLIQYKEELRMINEASPVLSVPGSGDVLSGAIATFIAWGLNVFDAATLGSLVHAVAGKNIEIKNGIHGTLAREIANEMQKCIK